MHICTKCCWRNRSLQTSSRKWNNAIIHWHTYLILLASNPRFEIIITDADNQNGMVFGTVNKNSEIVDNYANHYTEIEQVEIYCDNPDICDYKQYRFRRNPNTSCFFLIFFILPGTPPSSSTTDENLMWKLSLCWKSGMLTVKNLHRQ